MRQPQIPPIAIIGLAAILPQARNVREYWNNILQKIDCIIDVPLSRWNIDDYYDPDPTTPDKTHSKRGGFLPDIDFDPMEFGLPPNILEATDVSQLLGLLVAREALEDAGYSEGRDFARERTGVILGVGGGQKLITPLTSRLQYPVWEKALKSCGLSDEDTQKAIEKIKLAFVGWEENSFPGMLGNVIAGRITNRLNLGGTNCVVDAACASSLAALKMAMSELAERRCDMMLTGGVDTDNSIFMYMCFSKTPAITSQPCPRPFDKDASGMMVGEGLGMVVIKRLEDAERDGDRIYAVIKGIGTSSDGRNKSIYAPHAAGQARALRTAYEEAGFAPQTVGLVEAHGTGTVAGDQTEFTSLCQVFGTDNARKQHIALGSVKSQVGHTKAAAGATSLIKVALALHHKILPPTINVTEPHPRFGIDDSPFYINTETRPWIRSDDALPRRAGVSSFGFGGTNFHVVLEEYSPEHQGPYRMYDTARPLLLHAPTPDALLAQCEDLMVRLQSPEASQHYAALLASQPSTPIPATTARLGFVVGSLAETCDLLQTSIDTLRKQIQAETWQHPKGIYYRQRGMETGGKVVALFSGQGSQYVNMGRELALNLPLLRHAYSYMDSLFLQEGEKPLSEVTFPAPAFTEEQKNVQVQALQRTDYAQPALGVFSASLYKLLQQAGFRPDFVAGHSFGELSALWAGGVLNDADYFTLVKARGRAMAPLAGQNFDAGTMLAVSGKLEQLQQDIQGLAGITIANYNSPKQVVIAGPTAAIGEAQRVLREKGYSVVALSVSAAFHTPLVQHAQRPFAQAIGSVTFNRPTMPIYSNATSQPYPAEPRTIQQMLAQHILQPVQFQQEIEQIYSDGGSIFVEFGPRNVLTNLVKETLGQRPHVAIALNGSRQKDSDRQLQEAVVQLCVLGLPLQPKDPYAVAPAVAAKKRKGLSVTLNGSNYVSEKTRIRYEEALQDGYRIGALGSEHQELSAESQELNAEAAPVPASTPVETALSMPVAQVADGSGETNVLAPVEHRTPTDGNEQAVAVIVSPDYHPALESLERSLTQFNEHQRETLHLHKQYLDHQADFTRTFFQFMQQQQTLLLGQQHTTLPPGVLESINRSASLLSEHQAETLRVHEQYLSSQAEYSRMFFGTIQQQYRLPISGERRQPGVDNLAGANSGEIAARDTGGHLLGDSPSGLPGSDPVAAPAAAIPLPGTDNQEAMGAPVSPEQPAVAEAVPALAMEPTPPAVPAAPAFSFDSVMQARPAPVSEQPVTQAPVGTAMREPEQAKRAPELVSPEPQPLPSAPEVHPDATHPAPSPVASTPLPMDAGEVEQIARALMSIVSEKTGYPVEMLEPAMEMEADLGIDSIKRVEILGAMQDLFPNLPRFKPEELAELRTLGQISDYMRASVTALQPAMPAPAMPAAHSAVTNGGKSGTSTTAIPPQIASPVASPPRASEPVSVSSGEPANVESPLPSRDESASASSDELGMALLIVVSERTGYPVEMLEPDMEMEADLGIDSIKRVEILGAMQDLFPDLPRFKPEELADLRTLGQISAYMHASVPVRHRGTSPNDGSVAQESKDSHKKDAAPAVPHGAPAPESGINPGELTAAFFQVVSEKTGYPVEMLEPEMEMEADLGIDSIKRVEILGAMQDLFPDLPPLKPEELAELRTLGQISHHMLQSGTVAQPATVGTLPTQEVAAPLPDLDTNIVRSVASLKLLPAPDFLERTLPERYICLVTDDGTPLTPRLVQALQSLHWKVVVMSFPQSLVATQLPLPTGVTRVALQDLQEAHLAQTLQTIATTYGPVGAFVHLQPPVQTGNRHGITFSETEKSIVQHVFLLAKHLKAPLYEAAQHGQSCFLSVARLDGAFGFGQSPEFGVIGGGLFGLTKTLNLEWEPVFCRAIDLSGSISPEEAVGYIVAELHDPNRLITEVGYSNSGRTTLVRI